MMPSWKESGTPVSRKHQKISPGDLPAERPAHSGPRALYPISCTLLLLLFSCVIPTPQYSGKDTEVSYDDDLKDDVNLVDRKIARGEREEAHKMYKSRVASEPDDPRWQVMLAFTLEDDAEAEKMLRQIVKQHPDIYYAHIGLGRIYERWNTTDQAEASYQKAISLNPLLEEGHLGLARVFIQMERYSQAKEIFVRILEEHPRSYRAVYGQGKLALAQNDKITAREAFEKATRWQPSLYEAWVELAKLDEEQGNLTEAKKALLKAVALRPKSPEPVLLLARVNERLGLLEEAKLAYDRVAELTGEEKKDNALTREIAAARAKEAISREDWDGALTAIKEAIDAAPQDAELYRIQAEIFSGQENYAQALFSYETALLISPQDEAARAGRASILTLLGAKDAPPQGSSVAQVVGAIRSLTEGCFKTASRQFPSLAGKLDISVEIKADGSTGKISILSDTLQSREVSACAEWSARHAKFPAQSPQTIEINLQFK